MGVEVVGSEMAHVPVENVTEIDSAFAHEKENGKLDKESGPKEDIKFGSIGEEHARKEGNDVADASTPKDAVDEWPAPKHIHSFYFVRCRRYEDPKIQAKISVADREIDRCTKTRFRIVEELKAKRSERQELINQVKLLQGENKQYQSLLDEKKKEMEPLQQALGKLRSTGGGGRGGICSSEEELNDLIYSLQYRIQHESIPLTEEKQILREIKQLEGTREKVIANAAVRAKIQDSLGQKEAIQDQVKLIGGDLDGVRKEKQVVWQKISGLDEKVKALAKEIESLQKELENATEKREKAFQSIKKLRNQHDEGNTQFFHSRSVLVKARDLAAKKDIVALGELSNAEVDEFISHWCNDRDFRDDYEKRILSSLDSRMLSRDGRIRNPDEKPLVVVDTPIAPEPEVVAKPSVKRAKEDTKPAPQKDIQNVHKETNMKDSAVTQEHVDAADKDTFGIDKQQQKLSPVVKQVDEAKLKELKREEEITKAKQAMERKKKLAEKAAAKAAVRAQKEAEKKLKEREKKLKKKASASEPANELEEPAEEGGVEVAEPEKVEVNDEAPVAREKKARKENARLRKQSRDGGALPKAILRRKKATNYWLWAAPAALVVLILVAVAYYLSSVRSVN